MTDRRPVDVSEHVNLTDFDGLSFDVYGTLINREAGIAAVLGPWARRFDLGFTDEQALVAYSVHEAAVEAQQPGLLYPLVLAEAFRRTGVALGSRWPRAVCGTTPSVGRACRDGRGWS